MSAQCSELTGPHNGVGTMWWANKRRRCKIFFYSYFKQTSLWRPRACLVWKAQFEFMTKSKLLEEIAQQRTATVICELKLPNRPIFKLISSQIGLRIGLRICETLKLRETVSFLLFLSEKLAAKENTFQPNLKFSQPNTQAIENSLGLTISEKIDTFQSISLQQTGPNHTPLFSIFYFLCYLYFLFEYFIP